MRFGHWVKGAGNQSINGIEQFGNWSLPIGHCQMVIAKWSLPNGHCQMVIANWSLAIGHWQLDIGNWSLAISHLRECLKLLKDVEELKIVKECLRMFYSV